MSDDEGGIDLTRFDPAQKVVRPTIDVRLSGSNSEPLVHHGSERDLVEEPAIYSGNG